ncbi:MAG: hypothetical protein IIV56_03245 [Mailhella sp.]|nr:hypothetical protein [Mailhella sp.]
MEERTFSREHEEEVLELVDIVPSGGKPEEDDIIELALEDMDSSEDILELTEVVGDPLELADVAEDSPAEQGDDDRGLPELFGDPAPAVKQEAPAESAAQEAPSFVEEETFLRLSSELEERIRALEERHAAEVQAFEERLSASAEKHAALMEAFQFSMAAAETKHAAEADELRASLKAAEECRASEVQALQERLIASEEARADLAARVEDLQIQLTECSTLFLGDADVRLALEEMVSRMIEARMPAEPEPEEEPGDAEEGAFAAEETMSAEEVLLDEAEPSVEENHVDEAVSEAEELAEVPSEEEEARRAIVETIDALSLHVSELEERVASWEVRCEQEAALAAARVIREEIAAMRAGAARMAR